MTTDFSLKFFSVFLLSCVWITLAYCDVTGGSAPWRTLPHVQNAIGVSNYVWDGDSICFSNSQNCVQFYTGRRKAAVNGTIVWLNALQEGSAPGGNWRLAGIDLDFLQLAVLPKQEGTLKPLRVMLDPGHGGEDDGASSKAPVVKEKDLTLTLAKRIGSDLKKAGLHVGYTRTRDTALSLDERSRIALKKKADLFISIHANHAANAEASGVETYILPPSGYAGTADGCRPRGWQIGNRNDYHNTLLGFSVHQKLSSQASAPDRGLKRQSFFVLRETSCPAALIEFGFLSNPAETRRMLESAWQAQCASAVVAGILSYAKKVDALDKAVAEKRARDVEANERWRQHLAAKATKNAGEGLATAFTNTFGATPIAAVPLADTAELIQARPAVEVFSNAVAAVSTVPLTGTNAAPAKIDSLIDFYTTGKVH